MMQMRVSGSSKFSSLPNISGRVYQSLIDMCAFCSLPPTDCRLRPDQHAYVAQVAILLVNAELQTKLTFLFFRNSFEDGQFEKANELKGALETFQRATRSKRERGELPPHRPRWFERKEERDTQTGYWEPRRDADGALEYWRERYRNYKRVEEGEQPQWTDVEEIFGVRL